MKRIIERTFPGILGHQQTMNKWNVTYLFSHFFRVSLGDLKKAVRWAGLWKSESVQKDQHPHRAVRWEGFSCSIFCSVQVFNWLDEAHPHWGEQCAFLGPLTQMLVSPRNALTDVCVPLKSGCWSPNPQCDSIGVGACRWEAMRCRWMRSWEAAIFPRIPSSCTEKTIQN